MKKSFKNIVWRGYNAGNQHFLLFVQYFQLKQRQIVACESYLSCHLETWWIWSSLKFYCLVRCNVFYCYRLIDKENWSFAYNNSNLRWVIDDGVLQRGYTYLFRVLAKNRNGMGNYSEDSVMFSYPSKCAVTESAYTWNTFHNYDCLCSQYFLQNGQHETCSLIFNLHCPLFSSTGQRPASYCHGGVSVGVCVRKLFLQKTSQKLLTGFLRNFTGMFLRWSSFKFLQIIVFYEEFWFPWQSK